MKISNSQNGYSHSRVQKESFALFLFALTMISLPACKKVVGEGPVVSEIRSVEDFGRIRLDLAGDLYYTPGNTYKVELEAQQNILDELETRKEGDRLVIRQKRNVQIRNGQAIRIYVTAPDISALGVSGSGSLEVLGTLTAPAVELDLSGSGHIKVAGLTAGSLKAIVSGSGDIRVNDGNTGHLVTEISGSGGIDLRNLSCDTAVTHTSGSGSTYLNVAKKLDVHISGSGSVFYYGTPAINSEISGSGRVSHL